jgi:hypothetical protein
LRDLGPLLVEAVDILSDHHASVVVCMLNFRLQPDQFTEITFGDLHLCEHLYRFWILQNSRQRLADARGKAVVEAELHRIIESGDGCHVMQVWMENGAFFQQQEAVSTSAWFGSSVPK